MIIVLILLGLILLIPGVFRFLFTAIFWVMGYAVALGCIILVYRVMLMAAHSA